MRELFTVLGLMAWLVLVAIVGIAVILILNEYVLPEHRTWFEHTCVAPGVVLQRVQGTWPFFDDTGWYSIGVPCEFKG